MQRSEPGSLVRGALHIRAAWSVLRAALLALSVALPGMIGATPPSPEVDAVPDFPDAAVRLAELRQRIEGVLVYPEPARDRGLTGEVRVEFRVSPQGLPSGLRIVRSSGSHLLDEAARNAVETAAPLPRLYGVLEIPVVFSLDEKK